MLKQLNKTLSLQKNLSTLLKQNFSAITLEEKNRIAYITLANPKKRNILKLEVLQELNQKLLDLQQQYENKEQNPSTFPKAIVLKSEGKVFSAGHDLRELDAFSREEKLNLFKSCSQVMTFIKKHPLPVIAQIQGLATAAGCQLVASCDMAIGSDQSLYQTPGVKIGLFCTTPGVALGRSMSSQKKAMEMLCTGDAINAEEALQYGLINKVVGLDILDEETDKFAQRITCHSAETVALGKLAFYKQSGIEDVDQAYDYACEKMTDNLYLEDCVNGVKSFNAKQHPKFKY